MWCFSRCSASTFKLQLHPDVGTRRSPGASIFNSQHKQPSRREMILTPGTLLETIIAWFFHSRWLLLDFNWILILAAQMEKKVSRFACSARVTGNISFVAQDYWRINFRNNIERSNPPCVNKHAKQTSNIRVGWRLTLAASPRLNIFSSAIAISSSSVCFHTPSSLAVVKPQTRNIFRSCFATSSPSNKFNLLSKGGKIDLISQRRNFFVWQAEWMEEFNFLCFAL